MIRSEDKFLPVEYTHIHIFLNILSSYILLSSYNTQVISVCKIVWLLWLGFEGIGIETLYCYCRHPQTQIINHKTQYMSHNLQHCTH